MLISFNNPSAGAEKSSDHKKGDAIWNKYISQSMTDEDDRSRYMRINPELFSELPKFSDVSKISELERQAEEEIRRNPGVILEATHRLIASTFFFERDPGSVKQTNEGYICTGTTEPSFALRALPS
jgi:hypothetical protein